MKKVIQRKMNLMCCSTKIRIFYRDCSVQRENALQIDRNFTKAVKNFLNYSYDNVGLKGRFSNFEFLNKPCTH